MLLRGTALRPLPAEKVDRPAPQVHGARRVPASLGPEHCVTYMRVGHRYVEATSPGPKWAQDLRFSHALLAVLDVKKPGKMRIAAEGVFRYSDRRPRSQPQWEDLLALRDRLAPAKRLPMEMELLLGDKTIGRLTPTRKAPLQVPVDTPPWHARQKPRTVKEEVVVELVGEADLPAGRQELHRGSNRGSNPDVTGLETSPDVTGLETSPRPPQRRRRRPAAAAHRRHGRPSRRDREAASRGRGPPQGPARKEAVAHTPAGRRPRGQAMFAARGRRPRRDRSCRAPASPRGATTCPTWTPRPSSTPPRAPRSSSSALRSPWSAP